MKEFLEKSGVPYESVNLAEVPDRGQTLRHFGLSVPALVVGDRAVPGLDLKGIADLIGIEYDPPEIPSPAEPKDKYALAAAAALCRLVAQISPEQLEYGSPDRDRTLAGHAGTIMRAFVYAYEHDVYPHVLDGEPPEGVETQEELIAWAEETESMLDAWWQKVGYDDPLDRVVETQWGHRTLHEVLERAVWHPAQHTR